MPGWLIGVSFLSEIIRIFVLYYLIQNVEVRTHRVVPFAAGIIGISVIQSVFIPVECIGNMQFVANTVLALVCVLYLVKCQLKSFFEKIMPGTILLLILDRMLLESVKYHFHVTSGFDLVTTKLITNVAISILFFGAGRFLKYWIRVVLYHCGEKVKQVFLTVYFIVIVAGSLGCVNITVYLNRDNVKWEHRTNLALMLIALLCMISLLIIVWFQYIFEYYKELNMTLENLNRQQKDYYEHMLELEKNTRGFRHDIKNHLICMQSMLEEGKVKRLDSYIREMYGKVSRNGVSYHTGNDIVDFIINYYFAEDKKDEYQFCLSGMVNGEIDVKDTDLCIVISNLVSNAREAVEQIEEADKRKIFFCIKSGEQFVEFSVSNAFEEKEFQGYATRKNDRLNHGFGIKNMKQVAEENEGLFDIHVENDMVITRVVLKKVR